MKQLFVKPFKFMLASVICMVIMSIAFGLSVLSDEEATAVARILMYSFTFFIGTGALVCLRRVSKLSDQQLVTFTCASIKALAAIVVVIALASLCRYCVKLDALNHWLIGVFSYALATYLVYLVINFLTQILYGFDCDSDMREKYRQ